MFQTLNFNQNTKFMYGFANTFLEYKTVYATINSVKTLIKYCAIILVGINLTLSAAVFYCDPQKGSPQGDGSKNSPWRTIEEVVNAKMIQIIDATGRISNPNAIIKPGDTILLRSGWQGVIQIRGGFNEKPITIAADEGSRPQVGWVEIGSGKNWIIKGLTVSPSLSPKPFNRLPHTLVMLGERGDGSNLVVEDCFIFTERDSSKWSAQDWINKARSGIWLGRNGNCHIARNNYVLNTRFGIQLCATNAICEGNVIENFSADGIRITREGEIVRYNVIKNVFVGAKDGDNNHDDGIQAFLFNVGTGTIRDVSVIGNIIIAREDDKQPFPNELQGLGFFDGPLVNFTVQDNVVCVNHWHGITLGDAQKCVIRNNVCYSRWGGKALPWIMIGQKKNQARGNFVSNNFANSFSYKADPAITETNNLKVTSDEFYKREQELLAIINDKYGKIHPVAGLPRLKAIEK